MIKQAIALALLCAPAAALAQAAPAEGPVTVEIVSSGQVLVPAKRFRMSVTLTAKGADDAAAGAALATARTRLNQALAALGVRESDTSTIGAPNSMMSLFAGLSGRSKPSFSIDLGEGDNATQQSTASETISYDAPSRGAVAQVKQVAEANGAKVADEVVALLDDYVAPTRLAKADALTKARDEATAYANTLGLRRVAITKVSEKQDIVAGSMGFIMQIIGMIAPKTGSTSDQVPVTANLTVEFTLSR